MRVLFVSGELIGSALVHRLITEGHDVRLYIDHVDRKMCFEGFVHKTDNWEGELTWVGKGGLIVFDDVIFDGAQDRLRDEGYRVVGGSRASDQLETDRRHFHDVLDRHGVQTLPSHDFATTDQAAEFIDRNGGLWVAKQSSHIGMLNYVGQRADGRDVLDMLQLYKRRGIGEVHLQERVHGVEIGVGRYFNGQDWVGPIEMNLEHKPLCHGNLGPLTAEMGTLMWYERDETHPIFQTVLAPIKPYLQSIGYKGDLDINCIANAEGIWPLEATMRFGTPASELQAELHVSPWGDFLSAIADGTSFDLKVKDGFGIVVSVMLPPFPFGPEVFGTSNIVSCNGFVIHFDDDLTEAEREQIHFEEVSLQTDDDGAEQHIIAGKHGYALYVTGHGETVQDARQEAYSVIDKIQIPQMFYRTDIGDAFINGQHQQLKSWGWLR